MTDVLTKKKRSAVMAAIRSTGNKDTELRLMNMFRQHGITGWRRHQAIFGKPDFVFLRERIAVFVDGCYWHGCRWHCRMPKSNTLFWKRKITANRRHDRIVSAKLRKTGWMVIRIWEHSLRDESACVIMVKEALESRRAINKLKP
jgi:DNA mismatch endonuclease (patch repair protein)